MQEVNLNDYLSPELATALRSSQLDVNAVQGQLLQNKKSPTVSLLARCLNTVFGNRRAYTTRAQYTKFMDLVRFLIDKDPRCLQEILEVDYSPSITKPPKEANKVNQATNESLHQPSAKAKKGFTFKKSGELQEMLMGLDSKVKERKSTMTSHDSEDIGDDDDGEDDDVVKENSLQMRKRIESGAEVIETINKMKQRHNKIFTVTAFDAVFDPSAAKNKLAAEYSQVTEIGRHKKESVRKRQVVKKMCLTVLHTLFQGTERSEECEPMGDLELDLVSEICTKYSKFADINLFLVVKLETEKERIHKRDDNAVGNKPGAAEKALKDQVDGATKITFSVRNYQALWFRLIYNGRLDILKSIISYCEVDIRRTILEDKVVDGQTKSYIVGTKTALHELCSLSKKKIEKLGLSVKQVVEFAGLLIARGADPNAIALKKIESANSLKTIMKHYFQKPNFRLKALPTTKLDYYCFQTPLHCAIRAKNVDMVKLLAKSKAQYTNSELYYPRNDGYEFDLSIAQDSQTMEKKMFKPAADRETVPTVYNMYDAYHRCLTVESNYADWKFELTTERMFYTFFANTKGEAPQVAAPGTSVETDDI